MHFLNPPFEIYFQLVCCEGSGCFRSTHTLEVPVVPIKTSSVQTFTGINVSYCMIFSHLPYNGVHDQTDQSIDHKDQSTLSSQMNLMQWKLKTRHYKQKISLCIHPKTLQNQNIFTIPSIKLRPCESVLRITIEDQKLVLK